MVAQEFLPEIMQMLSADVVIIFFCKTAMLECCSRLYYTHWQCLY